MSKYIGVTYNTASGIVMHFDVTDTDLEDANLLAGKTAIGGAIRQGQAIAVVDRTGLILNNLDFIIPAAKAQLGITLNPPKRCVVINPQLNQVVSTYMGDPVWWQPQGMLVAEANEADVGWSYTSNTLTEPLRIDPITNLPLPQITEAITAQGIALL